MADLDYSYLDLKMSQKKTTFIKSYKDKSTLDRILWLIENYLPQKNKRTSYKKLHPENFETFIINKIKNIASARSKSLRGDLNNTTVTFTVGNWALPYLNILKRIKLLK